MLPKVVFFGGTPRGLRLLQMLIEKNVEVVFAFIVEEGPHEPWQVSREMAAMASHQHIPYRIGNKASDEDLSAALNMAPDVGFFCSWRSLIPKSFYLNVPNGCFVAHDSLLPKYRAFAPTAWAIINGEQETGVTLFKIDDGPVDSGDVFQQIAISIADDQTAEEIYPAVTDATLRLFSSYLDAFEKGPISLTPQDESLATYTVKRVPADGEINWNLPARDVYNFCRALTPPYPYAWSRYQGNEFSVCSVAMPNDSKIYAGRIPGRIAEVSQDGVEVLCGDGSLWIKTIKIAQDRVIPANEYLKSMTTTLG